MPRKPTLQCERCHHAPASVLYREHTPGRTRRLSLCAACTAAMEAAGELEEVSAPIPELASPLTFPDEIRPALPFTIDTSGTTHAADGCPLCGATLSDIVAVGKVGCAQCYHFFGEGENSPLRLLLHALTGCVSHRGQAPASKRRLRERAERLARLKLSLKEAVVTEAYEQAAMLRDEIRALENADETVTGTTASGMTASGMTASPLSEDVILLPPDEAKHDRPMPVGAGRGY